MEGLPHPHALIVEDNPTILLHASDVLHEAGFDVFSAGSSDQALDWLKVYGSEAIFLFVNVEIPGPFDGFGLARFVNDVWPHIAILVTSGRFKPERDSDMPPRAIFLPKPYLSADLLSSAKRLLLDRQSPHVERLSLG